MRRLDIDDFPRYTDVYHKYCPHCGVIFFTDRKRDIFHIDLCYRQHYSLSQRNEKAKSMVNFQMPTKREWFLRKKEAIEQYLFDLIQTTPNLYETQQFPIVQKFMELQGMRFVKEATRQQRSLTSAKQKAESQILDDLKEIVDYPPAFDEENFFADLNLFFLILG